MSKKKIEQNETGSSTVTGLLTTLIFIWAGVMMNTLPEPYKSNSYICYMFAGMTLIITILYLTSSTTPQKNNRKKK
jgi:hypothetical protein